MALSWNEIKDRAYKFSVEWEGTQNEDADAKPFLEAFFNVFGITRKRIGTFEHRVKKLDHHDGYIDMLWKGMLLIEMKSKGKDLDKAYIQAKEYMQTLPEHELPKCVMICDFNTFRVYDTEDGEVYEFKLKDLRNNVRHFGFMIGYQKKEYKPEDPVNVKAARLMGDLHDELKAVGYTGHALELYLVRLLFCLFADDTSIFETDAFHDYILRKTKEDGSDTGIHIAQIFQVLNTAHEQRQKTLDEDLASFPYVNGKLFEEALPFASWSAGMRQSLIKACGLNWGAISPAIFGSMFQSVMDDKARRNLGAHYTSEKNILKLIRPLFMDELWREFNTAKKTRPKLEEFHKKIAALKFIDPACGCGNFLVTSYRELRLLELEIIKELMFTYQGFRKLGEGEAKLKVNLMIRCSIDNFYGIEYEEFPAQIAQVAMWLTDHQMNMLVTETFGEYVSMLPLQHSATIIHGNALRMDWHTFESTEPTVKLYAEDVDIVHVVSEPDPVYNMEVHAKTLNFRGSRPMRPESALPYNYILGNPPFIGKSMMNGPQKEDMEKIFARVKGAGVMDYVSCWYIKAARYLQKYSTDSSPVKCAFVSTNSISQGEQVGILWNELFNKYHIKIHFAHRTFSWRNEARGNAAVHVVIIGFANFDTDDKTIFEYDDIKGEPHGTKVKNINPYLVEGKDFALNSKTKPMCNVPEMLYGNKIVDGGHYLFTDQEKEEFLFKEPNSNKYFKPILSGDEFISGTNRWVLYLSDALPQDIRRMPMVYDRVEKVVRYREKSTKEQTRIAALVPFKFAEPRQPNSDFLLIPRTSSEKRKYLPLAFFSKDFIVNDSCTALPNATLFHFGVLSSSMHMAWTKYTCGRLESRFRYSNTIVYNNYPWPQDPTDKQVKAIEAAAQKVLDARAQYADSSLADLYDPLTMPPALVKAHSELDKAVDLAYRPQTFTTEAKRMEFLFELYEHYTKDLFTKEKVKKVKTKAK